MNFLEKFCIHSEAIRNNQINEESTPGSNKIYDVVKQHKSDRRRFRLLSISSDALIATVTPHLSAGKHHSTTTL